MRGKGDGRRRTEERERKKKKKDGQTSRELGGKQERWTQRTHQCFLCQNARPVRSTRGTITANKIQPTELCCSVHWGTRVSFTTQPPTPLYCTPLLFLCYSSICLNNLLPPYFFSHLDSKMNASSNPQHLPTSAGLSFSTSIFLIFIFVPWGSGVPRILHFSSGFPALLEDYPLPFPAGPQFFLTQ